MLSVVEQCPQYWYPYWYRYRRYYMILRVVVPGTVLFCESLLNHAFTGGTVHALIVALTVASVLSCVAARGK